MAIGAIPSSPLRPGKLKWARQESPGPRPLEKQGSGALASFFRKNRADQRGEDTESESASPSPCAVKASFKSSLDLSPGSSPASAASQSHCDATSPSPSPSRTLRAHPGGARLVAAPAGNAHAQGEESPSAPSTEEEAPTLPPGQAHSNNNDASTRAGPEEGRAEAAGPAAAAAADPVPTEAKAQVQGPRSKAPKRWGGFSLGKIWRKACEASAVSFRIDPAYMEPIPIPVCQFYPLAEMSAAQHREWETRY